jgi:hypothetical protein
MLPLIALVAAAPSASAATAVLAPASGPTGERAMVWADGLTPGGAVEIRVAGARRVVFADRRGRVSATAAIPTGAADGVPIQLRSGARTASLTYRIASAWAARRSVEARDWAGHVLRVSADLDLGRAMTRAELSGLEPGTAATAYNADGEAGRGTAADDGTARIESVLPGSAIGSALEVAAGDVRIAAPVPAPPAVLVAVGDIACAPGAEVTATRCRHADTAALAARYRPDAAALLGDIQYESGGLRAFRASFDPTWGRLAMPLRPTPGNHEYRTPGAAGYFDYFAEQARWRPPSWYAYNLGPWHVAAVNSNCHVVDCRVGSVQERWLRADLAAFRGRCQLGYWHHPRFSSGFHGNDARTAPFWRALHDAGAELVLAGHDHDYERFAPQNARGDEDITGPRSFVVGTGGKDFTALRTPRAPNSVIGRDDMHGVLVLKLYPHAYSWRYVGLRGQTVDYGRDGCHD